MYGFVIEAFVDWLESRDSGSTELEQVVNICKEKGISTNIEFDTCQSDADTYAMVGIASEVLGLEVGEILYQMGFNQIPSMARKGYLKTVQSLGSSFYDLLSNLDTVHNNFSAVFPAMSGPSFKAYRNDDDTITLHYFSSRQGLAPYARGFLTALADVVYDLKAEVKQIKSREDDGHDVFLLSFDNPTRAFSDATSNESKLPVSGDSQQLSLMQSDINKLFPWHIAFDKSFHIVSMGHYIAARFSKSMLGRHLDSVVRLLRPLATDYVFSHDNNYHETAIIYSLVSEKEEQEPTITCPITGKTYKIPKVGEDRIDQTGIAPLDDSFHLKGQLVYEERQNVIIFTGIPHLNSFDELKKHDLALEQFPVLSNGRDMLFTTNHTAAAVEAAAKSKLLADKLDSANDKLQEGQARVNELLYSILPPAIADSMAVGTTPDAERYEHVSLLFSDIVGFTKISSSVPPTEVMNMLNELFSKFDELCGKYGVFKVETIGDAYMVASGLPSPTPLHADNMAAFAIEMSACASEVSSPVDGEPLQIRVGVHAGPCMAGVVGQHRPRYCLFGDTVNTASRMESTGVPGSIQCTYAFVKALTERKDWNIMPRGRVDVKGKGEMKTFFVLGKRGSEMQLTPPDASELNPALASPMSPAVGPVHCSSSPMLQVPPSPLGLSRSNSHTQLVPKQVTEPVASTTRGRKRLAVKIEKDADDVVNIPYALSEMTLEELMNDVFSDQTRKHFYVDQARQQLLLPKMTLSEVAECTNAIDLYLFVGRGQYAPAPLLSV